MTIPNSDEYIDNELEKSSGVDLTKLEQKSKEKLRKRKESKVKLTERIKELLLYVGFFFALIGGFSYIIVTWVLIKGFNTSLELENQILFSVISALIGLSISFALRNQGIAFAKKEPRSIEIMKEYYETLNKTKTMKQLHDIKYYLVKATIFDFIIKGVLVATSLWFMISIFIGGSGNYGLIGMAFANLFLFTGFGLIALSSAYDKYIDEHVPVITERTIKIKKEIIAKEKEEERLLQIEIDKEKAKLKAKEKKKNTPKKKPKKKPTIK